MCRLSAITTTNWPPEFKARLLDRLLLTSSSDEGQHDGHGIAVQTGVISKSAQPYWKADPMPWINQVALMRADEIVMGHVRKASYATGKTDTEAHPYVFDIAGEQLVLAHNGMFQGTDWTGLPSGSPATDTYRAGFKLTKMMLEEKQTRGGVTLNNDLITDWLSHYYKDSHYVVFILFRGELTVIRGQDTRHMHFVESGDGYVFSTSPQVLHANAGLIAAHAGTEAPEVFMLPPHHVMRAKPGSQVYDASPFLPSYRTWVTAVTTYAAPVKNGVSGGGNITPAAPYVPGQIVVINPPPPTGTQLMLPSTRITDPLSEDDQDDLDTWYRDRMPSYSPRGATGFVRGHTSDDGPALTEVVSRRDRRLASAASDKRSSLINSIREALNPMRVVMIGYWVASTFMSQRQLETGQWIPDHDCLAYQDTDDLEQFLLLVIPTASHDDKGAGLGNMQRQLLNTWNGLVDRGDDAKTLHRILPVADYFWLRRDLTPDKLRGYIKLLEQGAE